MRDLEHELLINVNDGIDRLRKGNQPRRHDHKTDFIDVDLLQVDRFAVQSAG